MAKTPTLADVRARRKAITAEITAIIDALPAIQQLREEDKQMEAAEQALQLLAQRMSAPVYEQTTLQMGATERRKPRRSKKKRKNSAEAHILTVLADSNTIWWTANEIKSALDLKTGKDIGMSTISPTLTAMVRRSRVLVRDGLKVALAERAKLEVVKEELPPDL